MRHITATLVALLLLPTLAMSSENSVVPQHEYQKAQQLQAQGPTQNKGIKTVTPLGELALEKEFPTMNDRHLRARELTIEPGGIVAVHQHDQRPGLAYILEGEIYEHRSDSNEPILRQKGAVSFEYSGVIHWWENKSDKEVKALVVDIIAK